MVVEAGELVKELAAVTKMKGFWDWFWREKRKKRLTEGIKVSVCFAHVNRTWI